MQDTGKCQSLYYWLHSCLLPWATCWEVLTIYRIILWVLKYDWGILKIFLTRLELLWRHVCLLHGELCLVIKTLAVAILVLAGLLHCVCIISWWDRRIKVEHLSGRDRMRISEHVILGDSVYNKVWYLKGILHNMRILFLYTPSCHPRQMTFFRQTGGLEK